MLKTPNYGPFARLIVCIASSRTRHTSCVAAIVVGKCEAVFVIVLAVEELAHHQA